MPKSSRSSRSRPRSRRIVSGTQPAGGAIVPEASGVPADAPAAPAPPVPAPAAAPRATRRTPAGLSAAISQRSFTDYAYVIGELKRIFVISGAIVALMLVLWLFIR